MPSSSGGFDQSYNAQAAVDVDSMLIVENHITPQSNDKLELGPAVENLCTLPGSLGLVDILSADTGYFSQSNVEECKGKNIVPYIAAGREQHNASFEDRFTEPAPLLGPADPVTEMKHRLKTIVGKAIYAKRKSTGRTGFRHHQGGDGIPPVPPPGIEKGCREWGLGLYCIQPQEDVRPK